MAENATQWYDGEGLPTNDVGLAGDYFLNTSNADIYKKISNTWQRIGNIRGAQGERGLQGERGEKGLKGDRGVAGLTGPAGPQGSIGLSGSIWYDGIGAPETSLGVINDFYLNIYNGDIYKKKGNNYWERISSFLPDLTYYLDRINVMVNDGYAKIHEIDATFVANMENMARTFNLSQEDMRSTFDSNMEYFINSFTEAQSSYQNTFNSFMDKSHETFDSLIDTSSETFNTFISQNTETFESQLDSLSGTFSDSIDSFNTSADERLESFARDVESHNEAFDEMLSNCTYTVDTYIENKDTELEERFRDLADVSPHNEILEARVSMDGTQHLYLKERLEYDFNNLKLDNLDIDAEDLINRINDIDGTLKE